MDSAGASSPFRSSGIQSNWRLLAWRSSRAVPARLTSHSSPMRSREARRRDYESDTRVRGERVQVPTRPSGRAVGAGARRPYRAGRAGAATRCGTDCDHLRGAILAVMGSKQLPEPSSEIADVRVQAIAITVVPAVHGHSLRRRLARVKVRHRARVVLSVAFALAALGTLIATTWPSGSASRRGSAGVHRARAGEKAAIAAAFDYPYPLRCLTITVSASDPDFARAFVDRTKGCGEYHG